MIITMSTNIKFAKTAKGKIYEEIGGGG